MLKIILSGLFLIFNIFYLSASVTLPNVFSDNMVLQQGKPVSIWGNASKNELITVTFGKQTIKTVANDEGIWAIKLKPMKANSIPEQLVIKGTNTITLNNVLVGEVWICCGQSNMDYPLDVKLENYIVSDTDYSILKREINSKRNPLIRYLYVEKKFNADISTKGWAESNDTVVKYIATTGYFFAKELAEKLKIPIGIISNAWRGTQIENWTPVWAYEQSPVYNEIAKNPDFIIDTEHPGKMFESMMKPLIPYTIKGFLWYQGESNCMAHDSLKYTYKFQLFTDAYRKLWNENKMPFYYVQLAPFYYSKLKNNPYNQDSFLLPYTWEAQLKCLKIPYTGMVVTTDLVRNPDNIHPGNKWEVGKRLSYWALAKDYGKKIPYSGPIYDTMKIKPGKIELKFKYTGKSLISIDNKELTWFTIAGEDRNFYPAKAVIYKNKLIVSSDKVKNPVAVRFAWNESAQPNFFNSDKLPASPFRTDNW
jgi:sialate O-acetylesterase